MERVNNRRDFRWMARRAAMLAAIAAVVCVLLVWLNAGGVRALGLAFAGAGLVFVAIALGNFGMVSSNYADSILASRVATSEEPSERNRFGSVMVLASLPLFALGALVLVAANAFG